MKKLLNHMIEKLDKWFELSDQEEKYYEFLPSAVAILEKPPARQYRLVTWAVIAFVLITLLWLIFSKVDVVVSATGKIVPTGKVKVVQSAADGVVKEIFVRDGQLVKKGAPLIEIDDTAVKAEQQQLKLNLTKAKLTVQRLKKELGDEQLVLGEGVASTSAALETQKSLLTANQDSLSQRQKRLQADFEQAEAAERSAKNEVSKLSKKIQYLDERYKKRASQAERGLIATSEVEDVKFNLDTARKERAIAKDRLKEAEARARSAKESLAGLSDDHRSETYQALSESEYELNTIQQELIKVEERLAQQVLRSPVDGVVQQLTVNTIGGYISRAEKLMVIVPEDTPMELNAMILNKDIGFVAPDQSARVKVDAFEYTRYGYLQGDLQWVGSDSIVDEQLGFVYPARIALQETTLPNKVNNRAATVVPGMSAAVDVVIGERRLINYFIGPLLRYRDESLRER